MPKVACVMMHKDEYILLEPWAIYHGHLFGLENLYIIDNGSSLPEVQASLHRLAALGVHVDYDYPTRQDYLDKGEIVGARIRALDAAGGYDFFFPIDCDEFVIKQTQVGYSCDLATIHAYLETLRGEQQTLRLRYQLNNHPLLPDFYVHFRQTKTFYAAGSFGWTDHGHRADGSRLAKGSRPTTLLHAHFHNKPFELLQAAARERWVGPVDVNDRAALAGYKGDSEQAARYLLMSAREYHAQFDRQMLVYFPQLRATLEQLGRRLNIPRGGAGALPEDMGEVNRTTLYAPVQLDGTAYLAANKDVADAGMDGLEHFIAYGFAEHRPHAPPPVISPQDAPGVEE